MKLKTLLTAAAVVVAVSSSAFAQGTSGQGPNTGTNLSNPPQNTKANTPAKASAEKDRSPASENSGAKQEK
jgi:hypothetical protein